MSDHLVREYYHCFNERRVTMATALFTTDAIVDMPPFVHRARGSDAYLAFVEVWIRAFPDAIFTVEHVEQRGETICEVDVLATGMHSGPLDLGMLGLLPPSGRRLALQIRELLEIRNGRITYTSLSFDINGLVRQLNQIDYARLTHHLAAIRQLADELARTDPDSIQCRDVTERLGRALDAARLTVRPHFKRDRTS